MLKVTLDTNILVSAIIAKGNEFEILKKAKSGKIELIFSLEILKEFKSVISRPKFGFSEEQVNNALKQMISISTIITPTSKLNVVKEDLADNRILECAEAGNADYIVSGDSHLLNLKEYKSIKIIRASEMMKIIEN